jgi:tRNA modification GTPase
VSGPDASSFTFTLTTPPRPGAIAVVQLNGGGAVEAMRKLTGRLEWPTARLRLCDFAGIDEGLAVVLDEQRVQLMPHGGPRVIEKLIDALRGLGGRYEAEPSPTQMYPEAASPIEADVLAFVARAASPAAVDLLAAQPAAWLDVLAAEASPCAAMNAEQRAAIIERSRILDRLVTPPSVVCVGPPNAGKSTLANRLLGESASVVSDLPGTTRDWVGSTVELHPNTGPGQSDASRVAVHWLDTPGLRFADHDKIENRAIEAARKVAAAAELVIAVRAPEQSWPEPASLPRTPELWVLSRADEAPGFPVGDGGTPDAPLRISAHTGEGLAELQSRIVARLGLGGLDANEPWCFSDTLRRRMRGDTVDLAAYLGCR